MPHVAGWAAMYLEERPTASPAEVKAALASSATRSALTFGGDALPSTPNLLMFAPGAVFGAAARASDGPGEGQGGGEAAGAEEAP